MEKIKEIIVVEGKNDTQTLQRYFLCDTIETGGDQLVEKTLERIQAAKESRGVIIFTDPDSPGEEIRRWINQHIPGCKNAFIDKKKARTDRKVGVEHAGKEDLWESLSHCVTFSEDHRSLAWSEFIELGLVGNRFLREQVCQAFHIGPCNAKTCFKRLNQMNITFQAVRKELEDGTANRNHTKNEGNSR